MIRNPNWLRDFRNGLKAVMPGLHQVLTGYSGSEQKSDQCLESQSVYRSGMSPELIAATYGYYPGWTKELKPRCRVPAGRRVITVRDPIWQ